MRLQLSKILTSSDYLLHCDMWNVGKFPSSAKVIDCGLGESNLLNIAGGLASQGESVFVYGVCGFIIHRYEQLKFSCRDFGSKSGRIVICNAGKYGYGGLGNGHILDDDIQIMDTLGIRWFIPSDVNEFIGIINNLPQIGIFYIQLGKDHER